MRSPFSFCFWRTQMTYKERTWQAHLQKVLAAADW